MPPVDVIWYCIKQLSAFTIIIFNFPLLWLWINIKLGWATHILVHWETLFQNCTGVLLVTVFVHCIAMNWHLSINSVNNGWFKTINTTISLSLQNIDRMRLYWHLFYRFHHFRFCALGNFLPNKSSLNKENEIPKLYFFFFKHCDWLELCFLS